MLKVRIMRPDDLIRVRELHEKYYSQFEFPDFSQNYFLNAFVIEDEDNEVVIAGGVEKVAEALLVTNKAKSEIKIGKALVEAQRCSIFTCATNEIRDLYAFVDNDDYARHLIQHGFIDSDRALKLRIP